MPRQKITKVNIFLNPLYICRPIFERFTALDRGWQGLHFSVFPVAQTRKTTKLGLFQNHGSYAMPLELYSINFCVEKTVNVRQYLFPQSLGQICARLFPRIATGGASTILSRITFFAFKRFNSDQLHFKLCHKYFKGVQWQTKGNRCFKSGKKKL